LLRGYIRFEVTASAERICSPILSAFPIDNREVEFRKKLCLSCLTFVKGFRSREVGQILVIRVDLDRMFRSCEVVLLFSEGFDDSYQFLVVDLVIKLRSVELLRVEGDGVKSSFLVSLSKLSSQSEF
jgi:hypothetical protein